MNSAMSTRTLVEMPEPWSREVGLWPWLALAVDVDVDLLVEEADQPGDRRRFGAGERVGPSNVVHGHVPDLGVVEVGVALVRTR